MSTLVLSPKYKAFLGAKGELEVLEGTTAAGKTTVGLYKFILKCAASSKKLHILAADDTGTAEKNIIMKDLGILDDFGTLVDYMGNGSKEYKMPHLWLHTSSGDKIIFVIGYRDRTRWKDALGGQYGCLYIDEVNTANMEFVREAVMRSDYTLMTLNPDDPTLQIYKEYINRCRPLPEWENGTPAEILNELTEPEHPGWLHWFFTFDDNFGLAEEKKQQIIGAVPPGTKIYKNKIQGLRGKAEGLVFPNFSHQHHIRTETWLRGQLAIRRLVFRQFTSGLDTSYSASTEDTLAMSFAGITQDGTLIQLEEEVYNNKDRTVAMAPSDAARKYIAFLDRCCAKWGMCRNVFVDSADQATIMELKKLYRTKPYPYIINNSYKIPIIDRVNAALGWFKEGKYLVLDHCPEHIHELDTYSYTEKGVPEDGHDHTINSTQYGWIPYRAMIGSNTR